MKPAESAATHPPETDFEIGGEEEDATDLEFSYEEDSEQSGIDEQDDDTFARTVMLDSDDFETKEGDSGLVGPGEQTGTSGDAAGGAESADEDELDFDLEDFSLDTSEEPAEPAARGAAEPETESMSTAETGSSGAEEDLEFDLSDLDLEEDESGSPATADSGEDSGDAGEVEFDLGDLEMDDEESSLTATGDTLESESELADMDTGGLEDLEGEIDETLGEEAAGSDSLDFEPGDFDLDTGETEGEDESTVSLDTADDIPPPEPESDLSVDEPAGSTAAAGTEFGETGDEDDFDTMIDLARAYIDMGDAESARATLEEVAQAGNEKQRSEAQSLLGSV
jgi:pilus assembly protein FimV